MGLIQKDAFRTLVISYLGLLLGYFNKVFLFIILFSTDEIGLLNLLVSVSLLFGNLSGLGSYFAIWRFFPFLKNKERKNHGFLMLMLFVGFIGVLLFSTLSYIFKEDISSIYIEKSKLFVSYFYWIIPLGIANLLYVIFDTFLRGMYHSIISIVAYELVLRFSITIILLIYAFNAISFDQFVILHGLVYFAPVVVVVIYLRRIGELHLSIRDITIPKRFRKLILQFSLMSYLNSICTLYVITLDNLMIAGMIGLDATGIYTTIVNLSNALLIPYKSMIRISSPLIADYWKDRNLIEMGKLYKKFSSVNLVIGLGMFLITWTCREELFGLLPKAFYPGIYVFLFIMIGKLFDVYSGLNGVIFITSKKYKYDIIFTILLMISVTVLNVVLIPIYGMVGSAIATGFAYIIYNLGRLLFVQFAYKIHPFERQQFYVLSLFGVTLLLFEFIPVLSPWFGFVGSCLVKWIIISITFLLPIYVLNLNQDIVLYVNNGTKFIRKRFFKWL